MTNTLIQGFWVVDDLRPCYQNLKCYSFISSLRIESQLITSSKTKRSGKNMRMPYFIAVQMVEYMSTKGLKTQYSYVVKLFEISYFLYMILSSKLLRVLFSPPQRFKTRLFVEQRYCNVEYIHNKQLIELTFGHKGVGIGQNCIIFPMICMMNQCEITQQRVQQLNWNKSLFIARAQKELDCL